MLFGAEGMTVEPGLGLMLWTAYAFLATAAAIVTGLKGQWLWLLAGIPTAGILWFVAATRPAEPGSVWARISARRSPSADRDAA